VFTVQAFNELMDGFNSRPIKNHALGSLSKEIIRCYKIMEFIQHINPKEMLKKEFKANKMYYI
jgi:hypothetical protein